MVNNDIMVMVSAVPVRKYSTILTPRDPYEEEDDLDDYDYDDYDDNFGYDDYDYDDFLDEDGDW